ncbi:Protein of unknown function [Kaistia soli DSM 19436]|uniref:DUF3313 domain-containing protein n=1 Tax=Kaistia soli DSM 19436 TaxID=1122133 RepID=A0A1M5GVT0_9HYPH|nr:DUF3313 domain-containing protein [Kaistia soli]SHG07864.1 Protein of unknown function [Kaistia soli DSM 19436]
MTGRRRLGGTALLIAMPLWIAGCANAPLDHAGSLSSYDNLAESDGVLTKSRLYVDAPTVLSAKTVRLVPTVFSDEAKKVPISEAQRKLITNSVDRSLCFGLSDHYRVVTSAEADLTVHAVVTHMIPTDEKAVGVSKVASVAKSVLLPGIPVPVPRLPIGMGSLSMEAQATNPSGDPVAAMVWGRGANFLSGSARVSTSGDAYELASAFGDDFSKMVVTGKTPFKGGLAPPSMRKIRYLADGKPTDSGCDIYGRAPGVAGLISGAVGAPPEWTDKGGVSPTPRTAATY